MATTTIPWGDGSGDNIYLTYSSASGDQIVEVSSDANTGSARTKTVTFTAGNVSETLTVNQSGVPQQHTVTVYPSGYDPVNYSRYGTLTNINNVYTSADSTTYGRVNLARGSGAETYMYFTFNLSSIPSNATIDSVSLVAKGKVNDNTASRIATKQFIVCRGTESVGTPSDVNSTAKQYNLDVGTGWTGSNINDLTLKIYAVRGTSNVNTSYYFDTYGADLTVTYTV